jgi:alpha-tubulin suppressor-like RCC1 family protein
VVVSNGVGSATSRAATLTVTPRVVEVGVGGVMGTARKEDGTVWGWGRSNTTSSVLGNGGTPVAYGTMVRAINSSGTALNGVTQISTGVGHTLALKADGTLWAWGDNSEGAIGIGTVTSANQLFPAQVKDAAGNAFVGVAAVSGGWRFSLAMKADGTAWGWGWAVNGQLGNNNNPNMLPAQPRNFPSPVAVLATGGAQLSGVNQIVAGVDNGMARRNDGTVWIWGSGQLGQLGDGTVNSGALVAQRLNDASGTAITGVRQMSAGYLHAMVLLTNGTALTWGANNYGELGDGSTLRRTTPVVLRDASGEPFSNIAALRAGDGCTAIRDATAEITPPDVRRLIHAQVAQALAQTGSPPGRVAEHWDAAHKWHQAAQAYESAAAQAQAHGAKQDELHKLRAATRCYRAAGSPDAAAAAFRTEVKALELAVAHTQLGEDTRAACEALLAAASTDRERAQAQVLLAHYWCERYEPAQGLAAAQTGLQLAQSSGQAALTMLAAQRLGGALSRLGRHEEAVQAMRQVTGALQTLSMDERLNWLTDFGLTLDYADQRTEALGVFDTVIDEATAHQRWAVAAAALSPKSNALVTLGRTAEGQAAMEASLALCKRAGVEGEGLLVDEATCAGNLRDLGHFGAYLARAEHLPQALLKEALALLDDAQASARSHIRLTIALHTTRDEAPDVGLARATALQAEGLRRQNHMLAAQADCVRMRLLLAQGDTQSACDVACSLLQRLGPFGPPAGIYPAELWWLAWQSQQSHEPQQAQATLHQAVQWLRTTSQDHVPVLFQDSFLERNPVNAALLAAAQRSGTQ